MGGDGIWHGAVHAKSSAASSKVALRYFGCLWWEERKKKKSGHDLLCFDLNCYCVFV